MKRPRDDEQQPCVQRNPAKRRKAVPLDRLSKLSDELLLKVLSFLPISELSVCQRLSHKYQKLASDGQLWKSHYYNRFVRPRASRLPGLKESGTNSNESLHFASKASRWLDEEHLVKGGRKTNWKRQYKLRHNWSKGSCAVNEIPVAEEAAVPPILVQMHDGVIYTADHTDGLRAWSAKGTRQMIAQVAFPRPQRLRPPTSMAVDSNAQGDDAKIIIGFEDGSFSMYSLNQSDKSFTYAYTHAASTNGVITSVSLAWPYALTMTATQLLSLYRFSRSYKPEHDAYAEPRLLHSLKSFTAWPPLSTSLRSSSSEIHVCVAYALPTYLSGWSVGVQETKLSLEGKLLESRVASAIDHHYRPLAFSTRPMMHHLASANLGAGVGLSTAPEFRHIHSKPTSLSYTHPYLLVSHPDNTLTLYLVSSTAEALSISAGSRLFGHSSSVSGAQVTGRGKAVSVSRRGDELRVWELEGGFASAAAKKRLASGDLSVQIRPETRGLKSSDGTQAGLDLVNKTATDHGAKGADDVAELTLSRGWIGFDDENVVVLKEESQGKQALVIYDFT